jgi:hypothetical protein
MANAVKRMKSRKSAGRSKDTGNIVVDLGEEIDKKLRSVVGQVTMSGRGSKESPASIGRPGFGGYRPGGYRPGMFGGYRPWYADRSGSAGTLGMAWLNEPVKPIQMLGGLAIGVVGNRSLMRVTPDIIGSKREWVHSGIAMVLGIIPAMVRPNSITVGVAIPGMVFFAGSLVDMALNAVGIKKAELSGSGPAGIPRQAAESAIATREKLSSLQQSMQQRASGQRVVARAV